MTIKTNDLEKTILYLEKSIDAFVPDVTMYWHKKWANERVISLTKHGATREYVIELGLGKSDPFDAALAIIKTWNADKTICRCIGFDHYENCPEWVLPF